MNEFNPYLVQVVH